MTFDFQSILSNVWAQVLEALGIVVVLGICWLSRRGKNREKAKDDPVQKAIEVAGAAAIAFGIIIFLGYQFRGTAWDGSANQCTQRVYLDDAAAKGEAAVRGYINKCSTTGDRYLLKLAFTKLDDFLFTDLTAAYGAAPKCSWKDPKVAAAGRAFWSNISVIQARFTEEVIPQVSEHLRFMEELSTKRMGEYMAECQKPMRPADLDALNRRVDYLLAINRRACNNRVPLRVTNEGTIRDEINHTEHTFDEDQVVIPLADNALHERGGLCHVKVSDDLNFFIPLSTVKPIARGRRS